MKRLISQILRPELTGLLIVFALVAAACSPAATGSTPTVALPAAGNTPTVALPLTGGETVKVANSPEFGQILVTPDGMTLYTNTVDTPEDLRCTNVACTGFWPPYTIDGEPTVGAEIPGSLGTVVRPDGSKQVTYNQQPLYTFYLDKGPGDTKGNGFTDFGGTWHAVTLESATGGSSSTSEPGGIQY